MKEQIKYLLGYFKRRSLISTLEAAVKSGQPLKVVIGASGIVQDGWVQTEMSFLNMLKPSDWARFFKPDSIDAIIAEHVWEHLTPEQGEQAIHYCFLYMKPGGYLRIAVPDGFNPDPEYINMVRPGGTGYGADDHKILYNYQTLGEALTKSGFAPKYLEHFDENGQFCYQDWDPDSGLVRRSKRYDPRNANGTVLNYSSVIMDGVKP
jgi:predicted SAM-dependent methyltransferase